MSGLQTLCNGNMNNFMNILKTILILILASLPLIGAAQIDIQLSFKKKRKKPHYYY